MRERLGLLHLCLFGRSLGLLYFLPDGEEGCGGADEEQRLHGQPLPAHAHVAARVLEEPVDAVRDDGRRNAALQRLRHLPLGEQLAAREGAVQDPLLHVRVGAVLGGGRSLGGAHGRSLSLTICHFNPM